MNDTLNEAINVAKERMSGPLGYISISFLAYNWSWFYYLIFSNKPAEFKISTVIHSFPIYSGVGYPVAFGIAMAITMPFILAAFRLITYKAEIIIKKADSDAKSFADEYAADKKLTLANKHHEATTKIANIEDLKKQRQNLLTEITNLQEKLEELQHSEVQARSELLIAMQESKDMTYANQSGAIYRGKISALEDEVNTKSEWNILYQNELEKNSKTLLENRTDLVSLLSIIKRKPSWKYGLSKKEVERILFITEKVNHCFTDKKIVNDSKN
ncbi:hypothetical protein ACJ8IP_02375 [Serratia sp. CY52157]|uniref:hypothetical protein n=1 Tax=Serratia TaxID=613 RepID=UPI0004474909|nr:MULTISPECIES: hypothetical protein [Serratia]EZQ58021.1 hypothetical protein AF54_04146 [Serratia marcescens BIDMC 81]MBJ2103609.1 hypothetical protein [Serratia ureilytica]WIF08719.1 hypothetical protein QEP77_11755 [Serratia sp. B1]